MISHWCGKQAVGLSRGLRALLLNLLAVGARTVNVYDFMLAVLTGSCSIHQGFIKFPHWVNLKALLLIRFKLGHNLILILLVDRSWRENVVRRPLQPLSLCRTSPARSSLLLTNLTQFLNLYRILMVTLMLCLYCSLEFGRIAILKGLLLILQHTCSLGVRSFLQNRRIKVSRLGQYFNHMFKWLQIFLVRN